VADDAERLLRVLKTLAPGSPIREGLENVLRARTGALIVVGDTPQVMALVDGGFRIDTEFGPSQLYELCKMDGAIILSRDARRILYANAQLVPDPNIPSFETGIRHRTAERVAKQTGELVIAISQRRNVITLYKGPHKYVLRDSSVILTKANQALQTLERYRVVLSQALTHLGALELDDLVTAGDVAKVVQRAEMVARIVREIDRYVDELGTEGRLVLMQLQELESNLEDDGRLVIRDYAQDPSEERAREIQAQLASWDAEDLLDLQAIGRLLGIGGPQGAADTPVSPRGYRLLHRIPRLPLPVIENLVNTFGSLKRIMGASLEELDAVEGIGEVRARSIQAGLLRLRELFTIERDV
jgi:diadenylate cyclase